MSGGAADCLIHGEEMCRHKISCLVVEFMNKCAPAIDKKRKIGIQFNMVYYRIL